MHFSHPPSLTSGSKRSPLSKSQKVFIPLLSHRRKVAYRYCSITTTNFTGIEKSTAIISISEINENRPAESYREVLSRRISAIGSFAAMTTLVTGAPALTSDKKWTKARIRREILEADHITLQQVESYFSSVMGLVWC